MRRCRRVAPVLSLVGVCCLLAAGAKAAEDAEGKAAAQAARILEAAGVRGGLVVHLGCGDGTLTAALAANGRTLVQGLEAEAQQVAAARRLLRERGLDGRVSVLRFDGRRLPYADNLVNLVVAPASSRVPREEILRVLAPGGAACLTNGSGQETLVKPRPEEIDEWTHFLHGPDNNAVADDTRVAPPRHVQWMAAPRWGRSHDHLASTSAAVTAAGRIFYIADEGPVASVNAPAQWRLVARDAFSGVLLWKKRVAPWEDHLRPFRSGPAELPRRLVTAGDRVYVTLGYGKAVTALDAATGEAVRTYEGTDNTHEILCHQGILYLVISEPLEEPSPTTGKVLRKFSKWRGGYEEYVTRYKPKHVRAVNAETGELLWRKQGEQVAHILPMTLTASGDRVFFQNETHLTALGAKTGEVLWRAERPAVRQRYAWLAPTVVAAAGVVISADRDPQKPVDTGAKDKSQLEWRVSSNHHLKEGQMVAFSAETGERLWTRPCHEGFNSPVDVFVIDGKVYSGVLAWGRQPGITEVYDLETGKVVAERGPDQENYTLGFGHHRCYRNKATTRYIIQGRSGVEFLDVGANRAVADHWVRGACQYGILPANGMVYAPPHSCACYIRAKLTGFNALTGGDAPAPEQTPAPLEKGSAYDQAQSTRSKTAGGDWPTYRHDPARSGATSAPMDPQLQPRWDTELAAPLTAVVVADGRLYVAERERHTLHALSAEDGSPVWRYTAGGRVDSPPTVRGGRVYFGSADGWMYCLRAEDGALAWRVRVAPQARQIVSYDQLESAWPVHGTVLVCDGPDGTEHPVAYAAAGRSSYVDGGVYVCGVDAVTGELLARRRICHRDPKTGEEPQKIIRGARMRGAMPDILSTDGGSLFMRHQRMSFDLEPRKQGAEHLFCSVGFVDDSWWHRTYWQLGTAMGTGYGGWTRVGNRRISGRILVKANGRVYGFGRKRYRVIGSHPGLNGEYRLFAADAERQRSSKNEKRRKKRRRAQVKYHWTRPLPFLVRAMVLADDALFIAGPSHVRDLRAAEPSGSVALWAVAPDDGRTLAEHKLDVAPIFDAMAAASGRLYLSTADGKVSCWSAK